MARFYGTVQGGRGQASRLGHANTGLDVTAQSYSGDVVINLFNVNGEDHVRIVAREHKGGVATQLYIGPIKELLKPAARLEFFQQAAKDALTNC
jgi:hypothetical protein